MSNQPDLVNSLSINNYNIVEFIALFQIMKHKIDCETLDLGKVAFNAMIETAYNKLGKSTNGFDSKRAEEDIHQIKTITKEKYQFIPLRGGSFILLHPTSPSKKEQNENMRVDRQILAQAFEMGKRK